MLIDVFVDSSQNPCGSTLATCTPDSDGLQYRRTEDMHGYVVRRGDLNVYAMGGVGVDRALLRRAALDARPVIRRGTAALPAPVPGKGPLDRLRRWSARLRPPGCGSDLPADPTTGSQARRSAPRPLLVGAAVTGPDDRLVPLAVPLLLASRHLPEPVPTTVPLLLIVHCWLVPPLQSQIWTAAPSVVAAPATSRHLLP